MRLALIAAGFARFGRRERLAQARLKVFLLWQSYSKNDFDALWSTGSDFRNRLYCQLFFAFGFSSQSRSFSASPYSRRYD